MHRCCALTCQVSPVCDEAACSALSGSGTCTSLPAEAPEAIGDDSCQYSKDAECDEPCYCHEGTDATDCAARQAGFSCEDKFDCTTLTQSCDQEHVKSNCPVTCNICSAAVEEDDGGGGDAATTGAPVEEGGGGGDAATTPASVATTPATVEQGGGGGDGATTPAPVGGSAAMTTTTVVGFNDSVSGANREYMLGVSAIMLLSALV